MQTSKMTFLNISLDNLSFEETLEEICARLDSGQGGYVVTPNVDHIVQLENNQELQEAYRDASLVLTDGQPLIWISHFLKTPIKEKISGSDLFPALCKVAAEKGYRMYFLGGADGVGVRAAKVLQEKYPGLQVCGMASPPKGFENDSKQVQAIWDDIHKTDPHILIICLGTPKQELFMHRYQDELGHMMAFGFGAALDFAAGTSKRAPRWMQKSGLEWLYRVSKEPGRLASRYLVNDRKIVGIVWKYRKHNQ